MMSLIILKITSTFPILIYFYWRFTGKALFGINSQIVAHSLNLLASALFMVLGYLLTQEAIQFNYLKGIMTIENEIGLGLILLIGVFFIAVGFYSVVVNTQKYIYTKFIEPIFQKWEDGYIGQDYLEFKENLHEINYEMQFLSGSGSQKTKAYRMFHLRIYRFYKGGYLEFKIRYSISLILSSLLFFTPVISFYKNLYSQFFDISKLSQLGSNNIGDLWHFIIWLVSIILPIITVLVTLLLVNNIYKFYYKSVLKPNYNNKRKIH